MRKRLRIVGRKSGRWMMVLLLVVCFRLPAQNFPLRVAVSKASHAYIEWLRRSDTTIRIFNMYPLDTDSALQLLKSCHALLLTGGDDIYPAWYGRESDTSKCSGFDRRRDTLEMRLIGTALEYGMPIVGICRGHQVLNVWFGGTLYADIPEELPDAIVHRCDDYLNCFHSVRIESATLLGKITRIDSAVVTTNHHQSVREMAGPLKANAWSPDGIVEGLERKVKGNNSFILGVQWHPERMERSNPLSGYIADILIARARQYCNSHVGRTIR